MLFHPGDKLKKRRVFVVWAAADICGAGHRFSETVYSHVMAEAACAVAYKAGFDAQNDFIRLEFRKIEFFVREAAFSNKFEVDIVMLCEMLERCRLVVDKWAVLNYGYAAI